MLKIKDLDSALEAFEAAAIKHAEGTETGDYKLANKNYTIIMKAYKYLKEQDYIESLTPYTVNVNVGVRLWAASFLLNIKPKEAKSTLIAITKIKGIHSLDAEMVLKEWEKGNLNF